MIPNDICIEKYSVQYKQQLQKLFCATAFFGSPIGTVFPKSELLASAFTSYYTDYEPDSLLVATTAGNLIGYLTGCTDTRSYQRISALRVFPKIAWGFVAQRAFLHQTTLSFLARGLRSMVTGELKLERERLLLTEYPAHLHINVASDWRSSGIGRLLLLRYLELLQKQDIPGVHLRSYVRQTNIGKSAVDFFASLGFSEWARRSVTLFSPHQPGKVELVTLVKILRS